MKTLIFCFDGTCNSPEDSDDFFEDSSISNILKLHAFFDGKLTPQDDEDPDTIQQKSCYYSGVGTRGGWLKRKFNAMFSPPYGDTEDILDEARNDLEKYYRDDTDIFVFGFSRGAAIARMFAANLGEVGKKVKFLGVFDTVAATRGSLDLNPESFPSSEIVFENGTIGDHIEKAVHLLSVDEKRLAFQPTLFNKDERITEVWFPGVHSDVGGGYWFDGLSDTTLEFMINCVKDQINVLSIDDINYENLLINGAQDKICFDDLNIVPIMDGKLHEQKRTGVKARTLAPRVVRVNEDDHISADIPIVHHSVADRFHAVTGYRPYALRNLQYKILRKDGTISEEKTGLSGLLAEERIRPGTSRGLSRDT